jgi:hypothetical protein
MVGGPGPARSRLVTTRMKSSSVLVTRINELRVSSLRVWPDEGQMISRDGNGRFRGQVHHCIDLNLIVATPGQTIWPSRPNQNGGRHADTSMNPCAPPGPPQTPRMVPGPPSPNATVSPPKGVPNVAGPVRRTAHSSESISTRASLAAVQQARPSATPARGRRRGDPRQRA